MIQTHEQFESALEAALPLLDDQPVAGSTAHDRLMALLKDIAAYRPQVTAPSAAPEDLERDRLVRQLDAFEARVTRHYGEPWHAMLGGDLRPARGQ